MKKSQRWKVPDCPTEKLC